MRTRNKELCWRNRMTLETPNGAYSHDDICWPEQGAFVDRSFHRTIILFFNNFRYHFKRIISRMKTVEDTTWFYFSLST